MMRHYRKISSMKLFILASFSLAVVYSVTYANTVNQWYIFKMNAAYRQKVVKVVIES